MIPELLVLCTAAGRDKNEQSWADSLSPLYYYSMFLNHTQKMFWYVKVTSEKQLWLENSQQWARIHSQSAILSVIPTISMVLRGLAMHGCAVLSSPALPFCDKCYLLGALGPSGGKSELNLIVFHSCLGWGASLHVAVCNSILLGVQDLNCKGLSCLMEHVRNVPCSAGSRSSGTSAPFGSRRVKCISGHDFLLLPWRGSMISDQIDNTFWGCLVY